MVRHPEVAALPVGLPPAVLDEEGAGAGRAAQEPPGRVPVVPADHADVVVDVRRARVVRTRRGVVPRRLVGHGRVHGAVVHDRPLDRRVRVRARAPRQEEHLLDVPDGRQSLPGGARVRIRVVPLEHRPLPARDVGGGDGARGAPAEGEARPVEVGQVVLREIETGPGEQAGLERPDRGEDPAGAVVVLKSDRGDPAELAQVVPGREVTPGPGGGGGRRRQRRRRGQQHAEEGEKSPAAAPARPVGRAPGAESDGGSVHGRRIHAPAQSLKERKGIASLHKACTIPRIAGSSGDARFLGRGDGPGSIPHRIGRRRTPTPGLWPGRDLMVSPRPFSSPVPSDRR